MKHPKKVLGVTFIVHDQTSEVLEPSQKPLDFRAPLVSLQPTSMGQRGHDIRPMPGLPEFRIIYRLVVRLGSQATIDAG